MRRRSGLTPAAAWLRIGAAARYPQSRDGDRCCEPLPAQRFAADAIAARGRDAPDRLGWPAQAPCDARGPFARLAYATACRLVALGQRRRLLPQERHCTDPARRPPGSRECFVSDERHEPWPAATCC